ncbi:MAG: hypothetical protein WCQ72_07475 [Eubacteriales bacterium]
MNAVRQLIMSLVCVSLISGIVLTAAPDGTLKKYLTLIISLVTTLLLISPLTLLASAGDILPRFDGADTADTEKYADIRDRELISAAQELVGNAIRGCIADKFSLPPADIEVEVICELDADGETNVASARITLSGVGYAVVRSAIAEYAASLAQCRPEVIFK